MVLTARDRGRIESLVQVVYFPARQSLEIGCICILKINRFSNTQVARRAVEQTLIKRGGEKSKCVLRKKKKRLQC